MTFLRITLGSLLPNKGDKMGRKEAREQAFKLVFEYSMNNEKNETLLNEILLENEKESAYITNIYEGVIDHYDALKDMIKEASKEYSVDRIFKVDFALIMLALYEIKYMEDIPVAVSINEVLNLAKKYSTDKSTGFINGVLSAYSK